MLVCRSVVSSTANDAVVPAGKVAGGAGASGGAGSTGRVLSPHAATTRSARCANSSFRGNIEPPSSTGAQSDRRARVNSMRLGRPVVAQRAEERDHVRDLRVGERGRAAALAPE